MREYCNPTTESLGNLARDLTRTNAGPFGYEGVYIKLENGAFERMAAFVQQRTRAVLQRTARPYDISDNHCVTFATEVAAAGGATVDVDAAPDLEVILVTRIGTRVAPPSELAVGLPSRQVKVLQRTYTPLTAGQDGVIQSGFAPPERPQ